jgi:DNA-binding MarR family transcriptional regulator
MVEDVPWLSPGEREAWLGLLGISLTLPTLLDSQLERDCDLNMFEYLVMAMLSEAPERTVQLKTLATLTNGSLSRLSHTVSRLEKRGYLARTASPTDRRAKVATLTEEGWEAVVRAAPNHVRHVRRLTFDPLSEEQVRQLAEISRAILQHIDKEWLRLSDEVRRRPTR